MKLKQIFYKGNRLLWLCYAFLIMLDGGINLLLSFFLQQITDATLTGNAGTLVKLCVDCLIAIIGMMVIFVLQYFTQAKFIKSAMSQYKNEVFTRLLKKSRRSFRSENTGVYLSALTNDATSIEENYLKGTVQLISNGVAFIATVTVMILYSPLLTLVAVCLTFLPIFISLMTGKKLAEQETAVSKENSEFIASMKDMLTGFPVVKSFRAEPEIERIYQGKNMHLEQVKFIRSIVNGKIRLFSSTGMLVSQLGVFLFGAFLAISDRGVTPGILIAFVNMMAALTMPISVMPQLFAGRKAAIALIEKMEKALSENVTDAGGITLHSFNEGISLDKVSFGYTEESDALKNISLTLEKGKSYAIVGGSGSGKSTLLDVIMGNYDNYRGAVRYDGTELQDIAVESLYDLISVVQQNVFIFDSTIRENITMFKEFPEEQVQQAIRLSGLAKLTEDKGVDYLCGENGCNLSGGERQRISIARCLLRKMQILVADEATAALDAQTAHDVIDAVLDMDDMTRIVVTHQLEENILKRYDKIIAMKNGEIVEQGYFDELLEKKGYFYSLYTV